MKTTIRNCLLSLVAVSPLLAAPQEPGDRPDLRGQLGPASPVFGGFGTTRTQDRLLGAGPRYEAEFLEDGVRFTPALGGDHEVMPLRLRLAAVARRDAMTPGFATDRLQPVDDVDQVTVRYPRAGYVETYELRADGIKQSFVFSSLPAGGGDLVVRLAVETRLPLAHASADEIRYERDGVGGIRIGEVIGIDARGERKRGSLAVRGDVIELSLPAAFVDRATMPLVLDPVIGGIFGATATTGNDEEPDVAYDASHDVFVVVWRRRFGSLSSIPSYSIMAQRLRPDGTLYGAPVTLRTLGSFTFAPRVANVNATNRFGVVWPERDNIRAASIPAGISGPVWTGLYITRNRRALRPCIAGDGGTTENEAIVAWLDWNAREVRAVQLELPTTLPPRTTGASRSWPAPGVTTCFPAISKGNPAGRHVLVWNPTSDGLHGVVVDRNLGTLAAHYGLLSSYEVSHPAVDGDGTHFVLAWQQKDYAEPGDDDVYAATLRFDPAAGRLTMPSGRVAVESDPNDPERGPSVAWMGDSALVAFEDQNGNNWDTYVRSIDAFGCRSCEGEFVLAGGSRNSQLTAIASQHSGGVPGDRALIVWQERTGGGQGDVQGRAFQAKDGYVFQQRPGQPFGGKAYATCANMRNRNFALRLRGAAPNAAAFAVISPRLWTQTYCSTGTYLIPITWYSGLSTNSSGDTEWSIPINDPVLLGGDFYMQWWVMKPPSSCSYSFSHSDIVRVVVQ